MIQGPDQAAWITDGGRNAIVRVRWPDRRLQVFPLPRSSPYANLNTAAFDSAGDLRFTGQSGYVGKLAVRTGQLSVKEAPRGRGPYGICATPAGDIWWCSLAGSFIARIDPATGDSIVVEPPTRNQGARRVWSDSQGRIWVSEWSGNAVFRFDPRKQQFERYAFPRESANVRQILGRRGEVWLPESGSDHITVIRTN